MSDLKQTASDFLMIRKLFHDLTFEWDRSRCYLRSEHHVWKSLDKRSAKPMRDFHAFYETRQERVNFIVSMNLKPKQVWIGDFLEPENIEYHHDRMNRVERIVQTFQTDCRMLEGLILDENVNLETLLFTKGIECPIIYDLVPNLSPETLPILDHFHPFIHRWFPITEEVKSFRIKASKYYHVLFLKKGVIETLEREFRNLANI